MLHKNCTKIGECINKMENGPLKMYHARQIVEHNFSVELPMCMYKMKNIHDDTTRRKIGNVIKTANHVSNDPLILDISEQVKQFLKVFLFSFLSNSLIYTIR